MCDWHPAGTSVALTWDSIVQIVPQEQAERENRGQEMSESWNEAIVNVFKKIHGI